MAQFLAISQVQFDLLDSLYKENAASKFFQDKYKAVTAGVVGAEDYEMRDGLLLYKGKLLLEPTSELIKIVLQECHSTPSGGHEGIQKTIAKVAAAFAW